MKLVTWQAFNAHGHMSAEVALCESCSDKCLNGTAVVPSGRPEPVQVSHGLHWEAGGRCDWCSIESTPAQPSITEIDESTGSF